MEGAETTVGMGVWLDRNPQTRELEKLWAVTKIGLKNKHGYDIDIEVKHPSGETMILEGNISNWDGPSEVYPRFIIFPLPQPEFLKNKPSLLGVVGRSGWCLDLFCVNCQSYLTARTTMVEVAYLRYWESSPDCRGKNPGFTESQPEVEDSSKVVTCNCKSNPDLKGIEWDSYV